MGGTAKFQVVLGTVVFGDERGGYNDFRPFIGIVECSIERKLDYLRWMWTSPVPRLKPVFLSPPDASFVICTVRFPERKNVRKN